jgi:site-specific DNA-cytosine methylase
MHTVFCLENPKGETTWKTRRRWKDNIRKDLTEIGGKFWTVCVVAQYRDQWRSLVNSVMSLWVQ